MTSSPFLSDVPTGNARSRGDALSCLAMVVLWSSGFVGAELGSRAGAAPLTLLGWRFVALAGLLVLVTLVLRAPWPSRHTWARQGVLGLLCQTAYLTLVFEGVSRGVPGGVASLIAALQPMLVATVAGRLLGEHTNPRMWRGLLLGLGGVALVVGGDLASSSTPWWAYALPFAAMVCLGGGTVLERRWHPRESLLQVVLVQSVTTAVSVMALAVLFGDPAPPASWTFWRAVLWLLVLSSLGGYLMYVHVSRRQGATVVSTLLYLTPPTTMVWTFLMFGRPITWLGMAGLVVSALGVLVVLRSRGGRARAPVDESSAQVVAGAAT